MKIVGFKLKKKIGNKAVGTVFDHFGGLVSGVDGINFTNKEYFEPAYDLTEDSKEVTLGVGNGSGKSFVNGDYESVKVLQGKLLHYEALKRGLADAINALNQIENTELSDGTTYELIPKLERILENKTK